VEGNSYDPFTVISRHCPIANRWKSQTSSVSVIDSIKIWIWHLKK